MAESEKASEKSEAADAPTDVQKVHVDDPDYSKKVEAYIESNNGPRDILMRAFFIEADKTPRDKKK